MFDLIVRGGDVLDGTGAAARRLDVGVRDGVIAALEPSLDAEAHVVVDATGRVVTPGFVDVHSHYDGQATWDEVLEPSTPHGVTTLLTGNCGVGFAPVRPDGHRALIELMEGVEDIPGAALWEGMTWGWESYAEYLDLLEGRRWSVDVGTQLAHGPVRNYVMGERSDGPSTPDDIEQMSTIVRVAIEAGAFGFSTSRTLGHKSVNGAPVPGTYAADDELQALGRAVAAAGGANFEVAGSGLAPSDDPVITAHELDWIGRLADATGLTTTFILLQCDDAPTRWRDELAAAAAWRGRGAPVLPLVAGRPFGVLWTWAVRHPFSARPSYRAVAHLPVPERLEQLRRPEVKAAILAEDDEYRDFLEQRHGERVGRTLAKCFAMVGRPDYEQPPDATLGARAERLGISPWELAYDELLADGALLLLPLYNYSDGDHDALYEQLQDPAAILGLNDGGAHSMTICDASIPTYLLTHWVRDRTRGPRIELADAVRRLTSQPADLYGLTDRGRVSVGLRADLNVIDTANLQLGMPVPVADLPAGGTRMLQGATGYDATIVAGEITRRDGVDTGARPGRLLRR
ncbi:MAG TPA: amidohydrolase family protein [Acidimicrobiia bacterium]|nr:amidohydrolase family protein [Acidimicrobiia bacterium]